jgi:seryl-tRNA synthetase
MVRGLFWRHINEMIPNVQLQLRHHRYTPCFRLDNNQSNRSVHGFVRHHSGQEKKIFRRNFFPTIALR